MNPTQLAPILSVQDLSAAIEEYKDYGFGDPTVFADPPVHAIFSLPPFELHLSPQGTPGHSSIWIKVEDLKEVRSRILKLRPNTSYEDLENPPSGYREFSIQDSTGNCRVPLLHHSRCHDSF